MPASIAPGTSVDKVSVTICGDGGCGKSSITLRLVRSEWVSDYDPTIEDSYSVTRTVDGSSFHLSLTDTAGQEEYRGLWASSNLQADAFLLVYDITNPSSLQGLAWFLDMIEVEADNRIEQNNKLLRERGTRVKGRIDQGWKAPPVMMIAGNKCDLNEDRGVTSKTAWDYAHARGCGFMETSAKEMINIEETFAWIVRKVVKARKGSDSKATSSPRLSASQFDLYSSMDQATSHSSGQRYSQNRTSLRPSPQLQVDDKSQSNLTGEKEPWYKRLVQQCVRLVWHKK